MLYYTCNIGIEFIYMILLNGRYAVLGPENNVIEMLAIARHDLRF
jgi:hypothetical protein